MMCIDIRKALVSQKAQLKITEDQLKSYFQAFIAELGSDIKRSVSKVRML